MIGKIEDVFTRQANFSADIAHEIRTPITNLVTQTEIALSQDRTQRELEDVLYSSLEEYNRMTKMVSDMLFLAQADNNQLIPDRVMFDLRAEVMKVFEFFEAWPKNAISRSNLTGCPAWLREIHKCSEGRSIICYPMPCVIPGGTGNHRLNKRAGELF
ncbi:histidine kinase dimerization/phospho-acceptor domain-containing protein [Enterobacter hormaechei]|uniref:histidine kinase dimerization/phospho-acceptor domain-containing protein n=1 Tax=Enterobacter hormaechei TaxID=158836 RepID=UPI0026C19AD0